jgi:hypothetical protein
MTNQQKREKYGFQQGFLCAICAMIHKERGVTTPVKETFDELGGGYDLKLWRKWGIDEYDIEILKKYRKELI